MRIEGVVIAAIAVGAALAARAHAPAAAEVSAPAPAPLPPPERAPRSAAPAAATLEEPCLDGGDRPGCVRALAPFATALAAQRAGTAQGPLRISFYGDSLVAGDGITHGLRRRLAALVGDGGPGFVFAAPPHPYCQHRAVVRFTSSGWRIHGIAGPAPADRLLGLGGSAETEGGGTIRLAALAPIASADVHYLGQPGGGALSVLADGKVLEELSTRRPRKQSGFARVALPAGTKRVELRASGRVRLFGAELEAADGAIVDNLGVVNANILGTTSSNHLEHWQNQLAHRAPDLVILMFGTNEAEWLAPGSPGMADHERRFTRLAAAARAALPGASCLVVSPLDQVDYTAPGLPPRASVPALVDAQRRAALAAGCAFWDTYRWMGGPGASRTWFRAGLLIKDFQHPTEAGAARLAAALSAALAP